MLSRISLLWIRLLNHHLHIEVYNVIVQLLCIISCTTRIFESLMSCLPSPAPSHKPRSPTLLLLLVLLLIVRTLSWTLACSQLAVLSWYSRTKQEAQTWQTRSHIIPLWLLSRRIPTRLHRSPLSVDRLVANMQDSCNVQAQTADERIHEIPKHGFLAHY